MERLKTQDTLTWLLTCCQPRPQGLSDPGHKGPGTSTEWRRGLVPTAPRSAEGHFLLTQTTKLPNANPVYLQGTQRMGLTHLEDAETGSLEQGL